ncbi:MAG: hypothetical protein AB7W16_23445 [Candidatus Obscuribacterales bacterium]
MSRTQGNDFYLLLSELAAQVEEATRLHTVLAGLVDECKRTDAEIAPSAWTDLIERNLGNEIGLEVVSARRLECMLRHQAVYYCYHSRRHELRAVRDRILAIEKRLIAVLCDPVVLAPGSEWRTVIMAALLAADEVAAASPSYEGSMPCPLDMDRDHFSLVALKQAFASLIKYLDKRPQRKCRAMSLSTSLKGLYSCKPVVPPEVLGEDGAVREMRRIAGLVFIDTAGGEHPHLAALPSLLKELRDLVGAADRAAEQFRKGEKSTLNERDYARRLVEVLDAGLSDFPPLESRQRQEQSRLAYEKSRSAVLLAVMKAESARLEVVECLLTAAAETEALDGEIERDHKATCEKLFTRRLAILLCLEADVLIREAGRRLSAVYQEVQDDISDGRGKATLEARFEEITGRLK